MQFWKLIAVLAAVIYHAATMPIPFANPVITYGKDSNQAVPKASSFAAEFAAFLQSLTGIGAPSDGLSPELNFCAAPGTMCMGKRAFRLPSPKMAFCAMAGNMCMGKRDKIEGEIAPTM